MRTISDKEIKNLLLRVERKTLNGEMVKALIRLLESETAEENDYSILYSYDSGYLERRSKKENDPRNIFLNGKLLCSRFKSKSSLDYCFVLWGRK